MVENSGTRTARPPACKAGALPAELFRMSKNTNGILVGLSGLEPPTSRLSKRSSQLSYRPMQNADRFHINSRKFRMNQARTESSEDAPVILLEVSQTKRDCSF